jgi:hypothetical protein
MSRPGWLARQIKKNEQNTYEWPEWMRREAGIPNPEKNAINDLRAERDALTAAVEQALQALQHAMHRSHRHIPESCDGCADVMRAAQRTKVVDNA